MTILPQEVWFADFPFMDDPSRSKDRPVIVLQVEGAIFMSIAFDMLSAALNAAIDDVDTQQLPRRTAMLKIKPFKNKIKRRSKQICAVKRVPEKIPATN